MKKLTIEEKKEKKKLYMVEYRKKNKDKIKSDKTIWRLSNKEKIKQYGKNERKKNKESLRERKRLYHLNKRKNDTLHRLKGNLRSAICGSFKNKNIIKITKTEKIIGCTYSEFRIYLESKFEDWMTWENYGKYNNELNYGWDIDHIIPLKNATNEEEIIKLNHYTNLQPLCSHINRDIKKWH